MTADKRDLTFLLQQLQQGSERAFSQIYDHLSKPLYRNILYLVKDEDIAEEILQDLFLKLWQKREHIDPNKKWISYLYESANRMVIDHFRKVAKDKRVIDHLILTTVDHVMNAEDKMINQEIYALLAKAIESLPPHPQKVFKLCKLEGKSYQEAADLMGTSPLTVRNQIAAAKRSVKEYLLSNSDLAIFLMISTITAFLIQHQQIRL
jgi:RNA polymerase sigma-70 factor (ECF subfamily)